MLSNTATPLYVVWRDRLGFSPGMLTVVFAGYIVGLLAALLVAGVVSDRVGRKPVLLPALVLGVVASVLFAAAGSVLTLVAARLLRWIAVGAVVSAVGMAAVADVAGPRRRRFAALLASTAMVLGAGTGPLLAGVLSETLPGATVTVFLLEIVLLALAVRSCGGCRSTLRPGLGRGRGSGCRPCHACMAPDSSWASPCSRPASPPRRSCCPWGRPCSPTCSTRRAGSWPARPRSSCSPPPRPSSSPSGGCRCARSCSPARPRWSRRWCSWPRPSISPRRPCWPPPRCRPAAAKGSGSSAA
ncbi:MFS transporter [Streptomyces sp. V4I2]|uniref:MFS transporter n=1 Tax=Streptomyces sp. V4I2 TaxID=3042280 RepID=UPI002786907C|nr:hypothetical protein [Streptomyces sp. V4I2]